MMTTEEWDRLGTLVARAVAKGVGEALDRQAEQREAAAMASFENCGESFAASIEAVTA